MIKLINLQREADSGYVSGKQQVGISKEQFLEIEKKYLLGKVSETDYLLAARELKQFELYNGVEKEKPVAQESVTREEFIELEKKVYHGAPNAFEILKYNFVKDHFNKPIKSQEKDNINPTHYKGSVQPIDIIDESELNFSRGCVVKYICRAKKKGTELEDLKKAQYYLNREIQILENKNK